MGKESEWYFDWRGLIGDMIGPLCLGLFFFVGLVLSKPDRKEEALKRQGTVIEKRAEPAGYDFGFWEMDVVYRPERYYLKLQLDNKQIKEMQVDQVTYMKIDVGQRMKNNQ